MKGDPETTQIILLVPCGKTTDDGEPHRWLVVPPGLHSRDINDTDPAAWVEAEDLEDRFPGETPVYLGDSHTICNSCMVARGDGDLLEEMQVDPNGTIATDE